MSLAFMDVVFDTAGLDDNESFLAVDAGDIAPCENDEFLLNKVKVGLKKLFLLVLLT